MKELQFNMSDIGFGANRLGIMHGWVTIQDQNPELASKINYIPHRLYPENHYAWNKKFYNTVHAASVSVYEKNLETFAQGMTPILVGGDHSLALGSVKASMKAHEGEDIGLVWIDAHGDLNTFEITESGNIHGMPVAGLIGINDEHYNNLGNDLRMKPENVAFIATRDVDYEEDILMHKLGILNYTDTLLRATSIDAAIEAITNKFRGKVSKLHISFDFDSCNPEVIKGVTTAVPGGLTREQPFEIMKKLSERFEIVAIDIVEYNPLTDIDGETLNLLDEMTTKLQSLVKVPV
ncbi:MAG: arginase family protein [Streptococcaceae bacterium]|jgi:arginase|nr:arginase family protein [Streptococcaceae bacterium]